MSKENFDMGLSGVQTTGDFRPVETEVDARLLSDATQQAISELPERLQLVVRERFWNGTTLATIAGELDVTTERARQLQIKATARLKDPLMEYATFDQIKLEEAKKAEKKAQRIANREDIQDPVPKTIAEKTNLEGYFSPHDLQTFLFTNLAPQADALPELKLFPNRFSCYEDWTNAAHQLKAWPDGQLQYFFTGSDNGRWFMVGALMRRNKTTDFESSRQSWKTETEKMGLFPVVGKIATEPVLQTAPTSKNKPFVSLESIYQFLTDDRDLSFQLTRVDDHNYWIFRTNDSVNVDGEASEEGFDEFRKYWYGVLKNTKAFTRSGFFKADADAYNKKVGLQICNKHNLLVYEANDDTYFYRIR